MSTSPDGPCVKRFPSPRKATALRGPPSSQIWTKWQRPCARRALLGPLREVWRAVVFFGVLCYLLPVAQQQALDMRYEWSVYQLEYSRNLLFSNGRIMEEVFQSVIDRTRRGVGMWARYGRLFGRKKRPKFRRGHKAPRFEVVVERPTYDLIIFKVHCRPVDAEDLVPRATRVLAGRGHRAQRQERISQGIRAGSFRGDRGVPAGVARAFLEVLRSVEACWVSDETLERLPERSQVGAAKWPDWT